MNIDKFIEAIINSIPGIVLLPSLALCLFFLLLLRILYPRHLQLVDPKSIEFYSALIAAICLMLATYYLLGRLRIIGSDHVLNMLYMLAAAVALSVMAWAICSLICYHRRETARLDLLSENPLDTLQRLAKLQVAFPLKVVPLSQDSYKGYFILLKKKDHIYLSPPIYVAWKGKPEDKRVFDKEVHRLQGKNGGSPKALIKFLESERGKGRIGTIAWGARRDDDITQPREIPIEAVEGKEEVPSKGYFVVTER